MLCYEGKISLYCFLSSVCSIYLLLLLLLNVPKFWGAVFWGPVICFIIVNIVLKFLYNGKSYQIAIRAAFLGFVFALGYYVWLLGGNHIRAFGIYMSVMAMFHYSEYLAIAFVNSESLSIDSFVINHSPQYTIAAISSWIEFALESYFVPSLKTYYTISYVGLIICIIGELIRKCAMFTAGSNFNHLIQSEKVSGHILVTKGIYSLCRHPSYVGWFYWAIGTQIILINPICVIPYGLAGWFFYRERVMIEEITLLNFFGQQYCEYQQRVPTGLPFIHGYKIEP